MVKSSEVTVLATKKEVTLSLDVYYGSGPPHPQDITGYLKDKITGAGISGATIALWSGAETFIGNFTTLTDGSYGTFNYAVAVGTYNFTANFLGNATYLSATAGKTCIYAKGATTITIARTPAEGIIPLTVTISGKLKRVSADRYGVAGEGIAAKTVNLHKDRAITPLKSTITSGTPATVGDYSFTDTLTVVGTYIYDTRFETDAYYLGCEEELGAGKGSLPPKAEETASKGTRGWGCESEW